MKKKIILLLYKCLLLTTPALLLLVFYIWSDPFKVIYKYNSYLESGKPQYVTLDKDYVSTQTLINNLHKFNYRAFIFGNSRSLFYEIDTWKKYIHTDDCFHFDASNESLLGIKRKLNFLDQRHINIDHALVILDYTLLNQVTEMQGPLFNAHTVYTGQDEFMFQLDFFKSFLTPRFLFSYLDFRISHKVKAYMKKNFVLNDLPLDYDNRHNEIKYTAMEKLIAADQTKFYDEEKMKVFRSRPSKQMYSPPVIGKVQYNMLKEISNIFQQKKASFKIIISPLYNQIKLNGKDVQVLAELFGKENIYDFSGINSITADYHNYYENSHYRPHIAKYIMEKIYSSSYIENTNKENDDNK